MIWTHPAFEAIADLLVRRTGLVFGPARRSSAETGIRRAMGRAGLGDPTPYFDLLQRDAAALDDLVVELTVGETYFFREPAQFKFLRREILPGLWRQHGPGAAVRAWSAACASGEEAYSLAILFEEEGVGSRAHLLATDISRAALAKARRAVYGPWSLRGEAATAARPYLKPCPEASAPHQPARLVLDDAVRRRVHFEYLNLALDVYPSMATDTWGMHIIFCRNVLIYFNQETIQGVARRLYESLAPGGWLLTASSDPPLAPYARFETVTTDAGVLYRRNAGSMAYLFPAAPVKGGEWRVEGGGWSDASQPRSAPVPLLFPTDQPFAVNLPPAPPPAPVAAPLPPASPFPPPPSASDPVAEARQAFADGQYDRAVELTRGLPDDDAAGVLHVRALANLDSAAAEQACAAAAARHPLSTELHFLQGALLLSLGRDDEAVRAVRRVLYLDRSLAVAHFTLGSILAQSGDVPGARRAYRNARDLCRNRPPDETAPLSDGESAGRLAAAAAMHLAVLDAAVEETAP